MNRITMMIALMLGLLAMPLLAQPADAPDGPDDGTTAGPGGPGRMGQGGERLKELLDSMDLTGEQREQIKPIMEAHRAAMETWRNENQPKIRQLMEDMRKARQDGDTAKADSLREELTKLRESAKGAQEDLLAKLDGILNDEQMAKVRGLFESAGEMRGQRRVLMGWQRLDLTAEQRSKIETILNDAEAKILEVLTPEQQESLKADRDQRGPRDGARREPRGEGRRGGTRERRGEGRGNRPAAGADDSNADDSAK